MMDGAGSRALSPSVESSRSGLRMRCDQPTAAADIVWRAFQRWVSVARSVWTQRESSTRSAPITGVVLNVVRH